MRPQSELELLLALSIRSIHIYNGEEPEDSGIVAFCFGCGADIGSVQDDEPWNNCKCPNLARDWMIVPTELGFALTDRLPANVALISIEENCVVTQVSAVSDDEDPYHAFEF